MSAPNPSMWIFPKTQTPSGYRELRIIRITNWAAGVNYYKWDTDHPTDTIKLDIINNSDLIGRISPIKNQYKDQFGRIRLPSRNFEFLDKLQFSGTINGVATGIQDLASEGKSVAQHIFNDKSDSTIYMMWTTIYDVSGTRLKITFTGDIDKSNMPDQPIIIRNDENPSNLLRTATITLNCVPVFDRMLKYKMRDLIFNSQRDGNTPIAQSDTDGYSANPSRKAFYAGFKIATDKNTLKNMVGTNPDEFTDETNIELALEAGGAYADKIKTFSLTTESVFGYHDDGVPTDNNNGFSVPITSLRNGFFPVRIRTLYEKIAEWIGCDATPDFFGNIVDFAETMTGASFEYNGDGVNFPCGFDAIARAVVPEMTFIWNIVFGISPVVYQLTSTSSASVGDVIKATVLFTNGQSGTTNHTNMIPLEGQEVFIEGAQDPNADGIWTIQNIVQTHPALHPEIDQYVFELIGSSSSLTSGGLQGTVNNMFQTPVTYSADATFADAVKEACYQFHYKLNFPITQSGAKMGMPRMQFKSRWATGSLTIPSDWKQGMIFNRQPRKVASDCVKVSQMGDSGYVLCPAVHKLPPLEFPPLRFRTHQVGTPKAVFPQNFIYNADKDLYSQESTSYTGSADQFPLDDDGWIPGSFLYEPYTDSTSNVHYPTPVWDSRTSGTGNGEVNTSNWRGNYALQAIIWNGGSYSSGATLNPQNHQFNACYDIARLAALELVHNQEIVKRDFANVPYSQSFDEDYEATWQEGGVQVTYRMTEFDYDDGDECIPDSTWEQSPSSYSDLSIAPRADVFNGKNQGTTSTGGAGGSSGGGTSTGGGLFIEKNPKDVDSNTIFPNSDTVIPLRKKGHSLTQSANLDENGTWDGATFSLQSGVGPSGTFFSKKQDAFELLPFGVSAGNTGRLKFFELAANGTNYVSLQAPDALAANNNYTLPNAYPSAISKALFATTAGVMSWIDINSLFTASGGISLSGTAGVGGVPGTLISINANALSLDRLVQIADQTVLGNISGSTGNVTAVAISSIRGLTYWTESQNTASPNNTVNATRLLVTGGTANNDAVIQPKGTGGFSLDLADSTPTGGNKRGIYSIDLQRYRGGALQVAAGDYSSLLGGRNNTIKPGGTYNVIAGGYQSTIDVTDFAVVCGGEVNSVSGIASSVLGGESNAITSAGHSAILGGKSNNINYSGTGSTEACTIIGGYGLSANNNGIFGYLAGDGSKPMTITTANIALFGDVDLWLANNDNAARALKFWAPWNTTGAFPSTNKFAAIKAGVVTTSYTWILPLADSAGYIKSDGSGNLSIDSLSTVLAGAVILVPGSDGRNVIAPTSNVYGLTIQQFSFLGKDSLRIKDNTGTVVAAFNGVGANLGDVAGASLGVPLYVRQFTGGGTGAIFEAGTGTPGDIIQVRDASNGILLYVATDGKLFSTQHIGTSKHIGAGTISPGYALHNLETTNGAEHAREENNAKTNDRLFDEVSTTTNANTVIHNFGMLTGDMVHVWFTIHAKQTAGAGGVIGHKFSCIGEFRAANVGGVAVLLTAPIHTDIVEDTDAETGLWKVTGVVNGSGIDIKVQTPQNNRSVTWKAFFSQKFTVNI